MTTIQPPCELMRFQCTHVWGCTLMRREGRAASHKEVHIGDGYTNCITHKRDSFIGGIIRWVEKAIAALVRFVVYALPLHPLTAEEFNDRR